MREFRVSLETSQEAPHFRCGRDDRQAAFHQPLSSALGDEGSLELLNVDNAVSGGKLPKVARATGAIESFRKRAPHFWRYPIYLAGVASAVAILLAAGLFVPRRHYASKSPNAGEQSAPSAAGQGETDIERLQAGPESLQKLQTPSGLAALIGKPRTLLGNDKGNAIDSIYSDGGAGRHFVLLMPVGTFVEDTRPTFRWQPLPGATTYKITVFDAALNEVVASTELPGTDWKSSVGLERGKVYLWQVAATRNGEQVVAPAPPAPEAKFEILDLSQANGLERLKREQPDAHFALGRAYANAGVLDKAEREFRFVSDSDANYVLARKFIRDLKALRHVELKSDRDEDYYNASG